MTMDETSDSDVSTEIEPSEPRMRWAYVFAIGLGFFTTGVAWDVYDSYVPATLLAHFITGDWAKTIIGFIMVIDNILALFMQPYIGARSDRVRTRFGRRMPFIMVGVPIAALFFSLMAYGWAIDSFLFLMISLTLFNVAMAFYRAPVVALMPDVVPSVHRSKANGVINLMGGIGAIYAFAITTQIYKITDPGLAAMFGIGVDYIGPFLAFFTSSVIMVVSLILLFIIVKEPKVPPEDVQREIGILEAFRQVSFAEDRSAISMLLAIFLWFFGYHTMKTWFTTYGNQVWGYAVPDATFLLLGMALSFVIFAVPAGYIAGRIGRRRAVNTGLIGMFACLTLLIFIHSYWAQFALLAVAGFFWSLVIINSIVIVWELLGKARLGVGTGLYYIFQMAAAIFGPLIAGVLFDIFTIRLMFPIGLLFIGLAYVVMQSVEKGEVGDEQISEVAQ